MNVSFDKSFTKSLDKIKDAPGLKAIKAAILATEKAKSLKEIPNFKKLVGHKKYYRIKAGNYRIGIEKTSTTLHFIVVEHRKNIYSRFP